MSDPNEFPPEDTPESGPPAFDPVPAPYSGGLVQPPGASAATMPTIGRVRSTGTCILLTIVTFGFYTWYWYYKTHDEMRQHSGVGLGGGLALVLAILVGIVMPFLTSNDVGVLYERRGQARPVSAVTGLWALLLGWFFFVGLIVWFVKTNGALNAYWRSLGAR